MSFWIGYDATWLEGAWDDEATAGNPDGWREEVDRVRKLAFDNNYEMRVQSVVVPGVFDLFLIPNAKAQAA